MSHVLQNIDFLMMDPLHMLLDLFEAREAIEIQAVRLAAERRTDKDMDAMEAVLAEMERYIDRDKEFAEDSVRFHSAVIAAAHNEVIIKINDFLSDMLTYSRQKSLRDRSRHEISLGYHRKIMEKIKERDADGAAEVMREHLTVAKAVIAKKDQ
jgi:GntR family transcriptional repressor for pyruvate dehydrogenase complex